MGKCVRLAAVVGLLFSVLAPPLRADINAGAQWLAGTAQSNGSYALSNDISTPFQSTAESLRAFNAVSVNASGASAALQFLSSEPYQNTENLSRLIIAGVQNGQSVSALVTLLLANQDSSGGFAELPGYQPTILNSAFALEALAQSGNAGSQAAGHAVGFLQQQQGSDGSWSTDGAPSIYLTALSLAALNSYAGTYSLSSTLQAGSNYLLSARQSDGLWGEDFLSGVSVIALLQTLSDATPIQAGVGALQSHQAADGSWGDDTFTTAVVLRALAIAQGRGSAANGSGAVQGYVTQAGSSHPIAGATVAVSSIQGLSAQTNADGFFVLSGLPAGNLNLVANKPGFSSASGVVRVIAGQTVTAANLVLSPGSQSGTLRVHLVDSGSGAVLSGATVAINGPGGSASGITDNSGNVEFDAVAPGSVTVSIQDSGYQAVQATVMVSGGQILTFNQPLQSSTAITGSGPATLIGTVVDATTNAPISGAVFSVGGGSNAATGADGGFSVGGVSGGSHTATVSASGYATQTLSIQVPAGVTASLGTISLYQSNNSAAPNTVTLVGTVIDGVSNKPVAGVSVSIANSSQSATSDGQGNFTIANIPNLSFSLQLSASGYTTTSYSVTASAYGSVSGTFSLPPVGAGGNSTNVQGQVTDATSGAAISGATVQLAGASSGVQTDSNGNYQLQNLSGTQFQIQVSALNYATQNLSVNLSGPGTYTLNVQLNATGASASSGFQVLSVTANNSGQGANQAQTFTAQIGSQASTSQQAILVGRVLDANGRQVAKVIPYALGTQTPQSDVTFAPNQVITVQVPWNPVQLPAGAYSLEMDVVQPGTISTTNNVGTILAEGSAFTNVAPTASFMGALDFKPPLVQAGSNTAVSLQALVANSGNVTLTTSQSLTLSILSSDGSTVLFTASANLPQALPIGQFTYVSFGSWTPSQNGNLKVNVIPSGGASGTITGTLYVGDRAGGSFTVNPSDVYIGTQTVPGTVDATGVDQALSVQSSLVTKIKSAVQLGSAFVATTATADQADHCLRCHIQSQSYFGLSSLLDRNLTSQRAAAQMTFNALNTGHQNDGSIWETEPNFVETQTALALWALTQVPDPLEDFATEYKAALYLKGWARTSGNTTYWWPDYFGSRGTCCNGWWIAPDNYANTIGDGMTMMTVKGYVHLLRTAQSNPLSGVVDYSLAALPAPGGNVNGVRAGPDGALYAFLYAQGSIVRYDLNAGTVSTVASGLPTPGPYYCSSPLAISANEFYLPCSGQLVHVLPNGTQQTVATLGSLSGDIAMDGNGNIYVSDYSNNQILKGTVGGAFTTFVKGLPLNNPFGLAVGPDGNLYVANSNGFNVLKVDPAGNISTFADGLTFPPGYIAAMPDGTFYVQHWAYNDPTFGGYTSEGLIRISSTGAAQRLMGIGGLRGVAVVGTTVYVGANGSVYQLVPAPLDTSGLQGLAPLVTGAAYYYLNEYNDGDADNIQQAERLIGLQEARKVITDQVLLSQVDQASAAINTLLRQRQSSDGGWAQTNGGPSDPIPTALVGMALDYLAPSANDPVVINAITYLLQTQGGDGSWSSGVMAAANIGPTSLVMAYLPHELDLLGGLNIELHLNFPSDIALSNPSVPQAGAATNPDGSTDWTWNFNGVTSTGRVLNFNLVLSNLQPGEKRPAATSAYLLSTNSFDGSQVRIDLPIPVINASDQMTLTAVSAGTSPYAANTSVPITGTVQNSAPAAQSGTVVFTIKAADGSVVATLPPVPFSNLASNASTTVSTSWNTGTTLAGTYPVVGDLYDSTGTFVNEQTASLSIGTTGSGGGGGGGGPNTEVTLRVTTDKATYNTTDQVNIGDLVRNISVNGIVASASLQLTVLDPNKAQVFSIQVPLGQLSPGYLRQLFNLYGLKASPTGSYTVNGAVVDPAGVVLANGSAVFKVVEDQANTIVGTEAVSAPWAYQGDPLTCNDAVTDRGTLPANNLPVRQLILNLDTGTIDTQANTTANLAAGGTQAYVRNFTTGSLAVGNHACVIQAQVDGAYKTLANAPFVIKQPPVKVSGSLTLGTKGRLLVLLDQPTDHGPPLCNTGLGDISLEADLDKNLSPEAIVEVKVLNVLGLIVDTETTSLKSFTGEVNANAGGSGVDLSIPSVNVNSLVVKLAGKGAGNLLSGTYRVVAKITDQTNLQYLTLDSGLVSLTCNVVGSVGSILNNTFTVIGLNDGISNAGTGIGDGADSTPIPQQQAILQGLLNLDGWSYDIVHTKNDFATKFRGGGYQDYALLSEYQVLDPQVQEELREHVYNGEGLLVAGRHDVRTRILDDPLGIEYRGTQLQPLGVQMNATNAYGLSGQESFTQGNQVQRFVLEGATVDGTVISGIPTAQTSLVTHNPYGNGAAALGGYDLLAEASAEKTPGLFSSLIRKPLVYVNPSQVTPLAGRVVPLHLTITNQGWANTTQAVVGTSLNAYVVAASAGTVANGKLTWNTPLAVGQSLGVDLWVQLSSDGSPVIVTATLVASIPTYTAQPVIVTDTLNPLVKPSLVKAIADLTTYVANQPPPGLLGAILDPILGLKTPAAAALDELKQAQSDLNAGNAAKALSEMAEATSYLINDGSASLKPIRLEVDEAIYQTEKLVS